MLILCVPAGAHWQRLSDFHSWAPALPLESRAALTRGLRLQPPAVAARSQQLPLAPPFSSACSGRSGKERENGGARARLATVASYGGRSEAATIDVILVRARGEQHADDLDEACEA